MDNQHRKIKGYRELSQAEIDLMNEIKTHGAALQALLDKCTPPSPASGATVEESTAIQEAHRWRAIARTHFQEGLMALTRSVARPEFF